MIIKLANIRMLHFVADKVGDLCSEIVFLFLRWVGCIRLFIITVSVSPGVHYTLNVDCIVDMIF